MKGSRIGSKEGRKCRLKKSDIPSLFTHSFPFLSSFLTLIFFFAAEETSITWETGWGSFIKFSLY